MALTLRHPDLPGRTFWRLAVLAAGRHPRLRPRLQLDARRTRAPASPTPRWAALGRAARPRRGVAGARRQRRAAGLPVAAVGLAARAEPDVERAARVSGAGPGRPCSDGHACGCCSPPIAAAAVLVFVLTLGAFAIPQVLGAPAGFATVTTRIYADLSIGGDPASFLEAVTLALLLVLVTAVLRGTGRRSARPPAAHRPGRPTPSRRRRCPAGAAVRRAQAAGLAGYLVVDVGAAPGRAGARRRSPARSGVPPTPANWTLDHFRQVLTPRTARGARPQPRAGRRRPRRCSSCSAGWWPCCERRRSGRATGTLITLTLVLPGSTLAVGAADRPTAGWLSGTLTLILLAYLAKLWAFAHRPIAGALDRLPPDELRAARASGAGPLTAVRTVALRPLAPALLAAWLICFLTALHEVTMSSLLYGPGSETLAVVVLNSEELGRIGPTAALSVAPVAAGRRARRCCCGSRSPAAPRRPRLPEVPVPAEPALEITDLEVDLRRDGGAARGDPDRAGRARCSRCWARRGRASRRCCTRWRGSSYPEPGPVRLAGTDRGRRRPARPARAAGPRAWCSRTTPCGRT